MANLRKILILIILIFSAKIAFASIEITEIMYDASGTDTNREWIEVYNSGSSSINLSEWYFFSNNTKHSLTPDGSSNLEAGSYAVIVQNVPSFRADWPDYSGLIFDSSWSGLNNEGDSISMKDPDLNVISPVSYTSDMGAKGDGNSLQKLNSEFKGSVPTPGAVNVLNENTNTDSSNNNDSSGGGSSKTGSSSNKDEDLITPQPIATKIIAKNTAITRVGFSLDAKTTGHQKEDLDSGKFIWSFGDGNSVKYDRHKPFEYSYQYPGEYILSLSYYESILSAEPIATDSIVVKVSDPELFIVKVGDSTDPFVEIKNQSGYRMVLSGWVLNSYTKSFKLPEGMAILPGKSVRLSPQVTHFNFNDVQHLFLYAPTSALVSTYPMNTTNNVPVVKAVARSSVATQTSTRSNQSDTPASEVNLDNLKAEATNAKVPHNIWPILGLVGLVVIGVGATIVAQKNPTHSKLDDSGLSASDIRIME